MKLEGYSEEEKLLISTIDLKSIKNVLERYWLGKRLINHQLETSKGFIVLYVFWNRSPDF